MANYISLADDLQFDKLQDFLAIFEEEDITEEAKAFLNAVTVKFILNSLSKETCNQ